MGIEAPTAIDGVAAGQLGRRNSVVDFNALVRALRLLGAVSLPIAAVTALVWAAVYLAFRLDPDRTRLGYSLSHVIIGAQVDRLTQVRAPSLAFVGDSACLMGVHVPTLRRMLSDDRIESFCTIAHVGPAGYARMLDVLLDRGAPPERVVIAVHPIGFVRDASWDWAARLVDSNGRDPQYDTLRPTAALDWTRTKWLGRVLYWPAGGPYALYFGGFPSVESTIRAERGSLIDPQAALDVPSLTAFSGRVVRTPAYTDYPYRRNTAFERDLGVLAATVARLGPARVHLLIMPVADVAFSAEAARDRTTAAVDIARRLGIPARNVLAADGAVPNVYLSDAAHMNRWGRILYTKALAQHLASIKAASH